MGEALYEQLAEDHPEIACRTYAPVGSHRDLLAYLVRRLLENGANSSFVGAGGRLPACRSTALLKRPADIIGRPEQARAIAKHSAAARSLRAGAAAIRAASSSASAPALDRLLGRRSRPRSAPTLRAASTDARRSRRTRRSPRRARGFPRLEPRRRRAPRARRSSRPPTCLESRARAFHRAAAARGRQDARRRARRKCARPSISAAITPREGRKLFGDGEVACRARPARATCCAMRGRGVFVAISPWNFPLAIFLGQVTAALMAGNSVVAKPAEQTPLIAAEAVRLLHEAGIPTTALHLVPGDGRIGAALVAHPDIAGVVFTGSTEVARAHQPDARRQGRPDRAADRRDRRHQRHDRRRDRAARAGRRRCRHLGLPLRRPALLGAAAAVRAGGRRRPHDRDDRGRGARTEDRRSRAIPRPMSAR